MVSKKKGSKSASAGMNVARCLNEAQRSISVHRKLVRLLSARLVEEGAMVVLKELAPCLAHLMLVFTRDTYVERVVRFVIQFVTNPVEGDEKLLEQQESLIEALLSWLLTMTKASEKSVRYRSCQLIAGILSHMPAQVSLPNNLLEELQNQIRCRLKDKVPQVRAQAARALARFQEAGEDEEFANDPITEAYSQMVGSDRNKEVRKVVLASIAVSTHTLKSIFMHTRDTCDSVRRTAYLVLASKVPMSALTIKQRNEALRRGLRDRIPTVKQAAVVMLKQWFKETQEQARTSDRDAKDGDTLMFMLDLLDVEAYQDECEIVVKELLENNLLNSVALVKELDASESFSLKGRNEDDSECLSSACAFVWRVLCETISKEAKEQGKAAASTSGTEAAVHASQVTQKLDALEQVLPASSKAFVSLIDFHIQSKFGMRFVVKQLLLLACECVEFADGMSNMHGEVIFKTLASERANENLFGSKVAASEDGSEDFECGLFCQGSNGMWESALIKFGFKVFGSSQACMKHLVGLVMNRLGANATAGEESASKVSPEDLVQGCMLLNTCFEMCNTFGCLDIDILPDVIDHLTEVCVPHEAVAVRRESIKLCGMLMLHSNCSNEGLLGVFATALNRDHYQVKIEAAKFFFDLAHMNGPKYILNKFMQSKAQECPLELLKQCLDVDSKDCDLLGDAGDQEDKNDLRKVVVEGFLKLLTNHNKYKEEYAWNEGEQCEVFTKLVFLNFDKECGSHAPMQQCISVFFDVYSMIHPFTYQIVAASILPVVKEAVRMELKPRVFGQLVRFLAHLIQRVPLQGNSRNEVVSIQQKIATSLICEMNLQVQEDHVWEEEEVQMKQIIPSLLKLIQKLDAQQFTQDASRIMEALLSRLPADNKVYFGSKDFSAVTAMFKSSEAEIEEASAEVVGDQATAIYNQYVSMQTATKSEKAEPKEKKETGRKVSASGNDLQTKENIDTQQAKAVVEEKSPSPVRRVLRRRNVTSK